MTTASTITRKVAIDLVIAHRRRDPELREAVCVLLGFDPDQTQLLASDEAQGDSDS